MSMVDQPRRSVLGVDPQHRITLGRIVTPHQHFTLKDAGERIALIFDDEGTVVADERGRVRLPKRVEPGAYYRAVVRERGIVLERVWWITRAEMPDAVWEKISGQDSGSDDG